MFQKSSPFRIASKLFLPMIENISNETNMKPRSRIPLRLVNEIRALLSIESSDGLSELSEPWIEIIPSSSQVANDGKSSSGSGYFSMFISPSEIIAMVLDPIPPNSHTSPLLSPIAT